MFEDYVIVNSSDGGVCIVDIDDKGGSFVSSESSKDGCVV